MEDRYTLLDLPDVFDAYYTVQWHTSIEDDEPRHTLIHVERHEFIGDTADYAFIAAGMAFKTKEAAERNKYVAYKELIGKEYGKNKLRNESKMLTI